MAKSRSTRKKEKLSEPKVMGLAPQQVSGELAALYGRSKKIHLAVKENRYSNVAYVQVSPRDVFIDFLQAPGLPDGDEVRVEVTRVYLPTTAAKSLGEVLTRMVEDLRKAGKYEKLE